MGIAHFGHNLQPDKKGVMAEVAASPSDPIFINHHGMMDCILEEWLQKNKDAQYPHDPKIRRGHRKNDNTVPFFPVVTHGEMFKTADNFGYSCSLSDTAAIKRGPAAAWLFFSICVIPVTGKEFPKQYLLIPHSKISVLFVSCCTKYGVYHTQYNAINLYDVHTWRAVCRCVCMSGEISILT